MKTFDGNDPPRLDFNVAHTHTIKFEPQKEAPKIKLDVSLEHKLTIDKQVLLMMIVAIPVYFFTKGKYVKYVKIFFAVLTETKHFIEQFELSRRRTRKNE